MGRRGIRRAVVAAVTVVVVATGCEWVLPGYGPGGTHHNPQEQDLGVAEVRTLTADWVATLGSSAGTTAIPVVKSNVIVTATDGRLRAFAADGSQGCTTGTLPTCAPIWSSGTGPFLDQPII